MKYKLLSAAIIAATATPAVFASDVTVYGKVNISYNQIEKDEAGTIEQDNWELETFASRVGVKGSEEINDNLKAVYKVEYQIVPDGEGGDREFKARNSYVGIQGNLGTLVAGNHDTPLKMSSSIGKIDVFNDYSLGDIGLSIPGERRENDIIMYRSPSMGAFSVIAAIMPGDDSGATGDDKNNGFADQISAVAMYRGKKAYAAIAFDDNVNGMDIMRLNGSYKFGNVTLAAQYQKAKDSDLDNGKGLADNVKGAIHAALGDAETATGFIAEDQESYLVSAAWKINKWTLKAQYIDSTYEDNSQSLDNTAMTVGVDYKLSKYTKLYSHYTQLTADANSAIGIDGDYDYTGTGLIGIEHKF
jgi:predicted porin